MRTGLKVVANNPSFPEQGSVYWFDPEPIKGSEFNKVRPCVVVSPDEMNRHLNTVIVAPLTSTIKAWPFRCTAQILGQRSSIACDQLRAVDKSRLRAYITTLQASDKQAVTSLLSVMFS